MMLLASLLILISLGGSFSERNCFERQDDECGDRAHRMWRKGFPETQEELMQACQDVQDLGNCIADVRDSCGMEKGSSGVRRLVSYLSSTCEEDNPTFRDISNNLRCIKHVFGIIGRAPCTYSSEKKGVFNDLIDPYFEEDRGDDFYRCFRRVRENICMMNIFEHHCGVEAAAAVYEVHRAFEDERYGDVCSEEVLQELEPFMETYGAMLNEQFELHERFEKKRK